MIFGALYSWCALWHFATACDIIGILIYTNTDWLDTDCKTLLESGSPFGPLLDAPLSWSIDKRVFSLSFDSFWEHCCFSWASALKQPLVELIAIILPVASVLVAPVIYLLMVSMQMAGVFTNRPSPHTHLTHCLGMVNIPLNAVLSFTGRNRLESTIQAVTSSTLCEAKLRGSVFELTPVLKLSNLWNYFKWMNQWMVS